MEQQTRAHDSRPFLTVITWPEGFSRAQLAQLLSQHCGLDAVTLRLRLGKEGPSILGQVAPELAPPTINTIEETGGEAFAVTLHDLASLGPSLLLRDLALQQDGSLNVQLWNDLTTTIRRDHIQLLIRGQLHEKEKSPTTLTSRPTTLGAAGRMLTSRTGATALGGMGLAAIFGGGYLADAPSPQYQKVRVKNKLDIHTADGSVYQILGNRFTFDILGDERGYTENQNMDSLCDLLSGLSRDIIVDPYFPLWRPPPGYQRLRLPRTRAPRDPAFDFYSRWAALMYRHLMGELDRRLGIDP